MTNVSEVKQLLKDFKETEFDIVIEEFSLYKKGYAINPQLVNRDRRLPIEAKVLYGLFKLYSNNTTDNINYFPKVANIIKMLRMGYKNYYAKALHPLLKYNYITIQYNYVNGERTTNTYIIMSNPNYDLDKELIGYLNPDEVKKTGLSHGKFGRTPRQVILDENLSLTAKGIYLYLSSFAGFDGFCFPDKEKMMMELDLKITRFDNNYKLLKIYNYIEVVTLREGKCNKGLAYYIVENPNPSNYSTKTRFIYINSSNDIRQEITNTMTKESDEILTNNTSVKINTNEEQNNSSRIMNDNYRFYLQKFYGQPLSIEQQKEKLEKRFSPIFRQYITEMKSIGNKSNFEELNEFHNIILDFYATAIIDKKGDIVTYPIKGYETQLERIQDTIYKYFDLNVLKTIRENLINYKQRTTNTIGFLITTLYTTCSSCYHANKFNDNYDKEQTRILKDLLNL